MKDLEKGIYDAAVALEGGAKPMEVAATLRELSAPEVKPCPCCGTEPEMICDTDWDRRIYCPECGLTTRMGAADEIIRAWNRRVDP